MPSVEQPGEEADRFCSGEPLTLPVAQCTQLTLLSNNNNTSLSLIISKLSFLCTSRVKPQSSLNDVELGCLPACHFVIFQFIYMCLHPSIASAGSSRSSLCSMVYCIAHYWLFASSGSDESRSNHCSVACIKLLQLL